MTLRDRLSRGSSVVAFAALLGASLPISPVAAAEPVNVVFSFTGAEQSWIVPDGVTSIQVALVGGNGGGASSLGFAHRVTGDLSVSPGATLYIEVAGKGAASTGLSGAAGGFNGGGSGGAGTANGGAGGGGASDIRTVARSEPLSLESRLIVAAGGGGSGGAVGPFGGHGGNAGDNGVSGSPGPGLSGGFGQQGYASSGGPGGFGSFEFGAQSGLAGDLGGGGGGGDSTDPNGNGGGGGGGGYYGGGGGGGGAGAGGGGGGGGYTFTGGAQNASITLNDGADPSVTISYLDDSPPPAPDTGVVDADVTVPTSAACIELSATSISFGTQRFGTEDVLAEPGITVTNCSGVEEALLARGTDATGSGAAWQLVDNTATCGGGTLATDDFHLKIRRPANEADPVTQLSKDNKQIAELGAGDDAVLEALLDMPCPGSAGAGQTMGMQIVFVVTELE